MMPYLSDEWIAALDGALRAHGPFGTTSAAIRIRTIVRDVSDAGHPGPGDIAYELVLNGEDLGARRVPLPAPPPVAASPDEAPATVTFSVDAATAAAIASGAQSAQAAFMAGRLRVHGDTRRLMEHQALLAELDDVFAPVRAVTDFAIVS